MKSAGRRVQHHSQCHTADEIASKGGCADGSNGTKEIKMEGSLGRVDRCGEDIDLDKSQGHEAC